MIITAKEMKDFELNPIIETKHYVSQYETATEMIKKLKQRVWLYGGDDKEALSHIAYFNLFEKGKVELKKCIRRTLNAYEETFPIWHEWLKPNQFGIGEALAAQLIIRLNYKFIPIMEDCPHCKGKKCSRCKNTGQKKKAPPEFVIERRHWHNPSSIHHFCGVHCVYDEELGMNRAARRSDLAENGIERKEGGGYSTAMGPILWQIEGQFMQHGKAYREIFDLFWEEIKRKKPENGCQWCKDKKLSHKKHQVQMARRKTAKVFLTHWYVVDYTLRGLPVTKPYPISILGHTNYIKPPYFDKEIVYLESQNRRNPSMICEPAIS